LDISNFLLYVYRANQNDHLMIWKIGTIDQVHSFVSASNFQGSTANIQGLTFLPSSSSHEKIFNPTEKTRSQYHADIHANRIRANKERQGCQGERTGRYLRTNEVRRRIHAWIDQRGGCTRMKFFTVTFHNGTTDQQAAKAFNIFLTRWRKCSPDLNYLWTAERQKNTTAHYHMVTDSYMCIKKLNGFMRATLKNMAHEIENKGASKICDYNGVTLSPPVFSRGGVESYLVKYLTKAMESGFRQPWHCSRNIGKLATRAKLDLQSSFSAIAMEVRRGKQRERLVRYLDGGNFIYVPFYSKVNTFVASRLLRYNQDKWASNIQSIRFRSRAKPVEHPKEHPLNTSHQADGVQLPLLHVPIQSGNWKGRKSAYLN